MKTFVDAQKDYDQLEIYRKWLRDNNVSFQEDEDGEALYFCYQGGNFKYKKGYFPFSIKEVIL